MREAEALNRQVLQLYGQGRYAEGVPLAEKALAIREQALGPEHPDVATSLNNLALLYGSLGDYAKAEPLYQRALAISEKALGPEHPNVATSLNNLAELYRTLGDYAKAEPLYQRALAISEKALGPEHPSVATSLSSLAALYWTLGDYAKAEPLFRRSLAILEKALGPEHPDVATSLNNLALLYQALGDYSKALPLYQRALAINEKAFGPEHPNVAASLNNLARLYQALGDYPKAESLYQRALAIREKALGPEHPDVTTSLNNLANLYHNLGDYAKAEPLYQRALAIREKALGPEHPNVATSLNNLAALYQALGDYAKAEPLYQRALAINEKALGPDHPDVALSLNNLANLYHNLGDYAKAEPLYQRALAIREKALGPEHPNVATSLNNLAELYRALGDYAKAEPLYQRALAIREKALGPDHPSVAQSLNNLAALYQDLGDYAKAEPLYQRALAIFEKALGPEHPNVATSLNNLALLYQDLGDYAKAEPLYRRSLAIYERALGPEHPNVALSLNNLAILQVAIGRVQPARVLFTRSQTIDAKVIDQVMGFTSEEQKLAFLRTRERSLHGFLSLVYQALRTDPTARAEALTAWLQRKGVALEAQRRFQEALAYSDDPEAMKVFRELAAVRADLSRLVFGGPGKEGAEAYRKRLADLEARNAQLEARLSTLSQAFATRQKVAHADARVVALALPKDTALLEFARINVFNFTAKGTEKKWYPARYLAFILHAGTGDQVGLVDLGEAEKIEKAIEAFRQTLRAGTDPGDVKVVQAARTLHDLVFAPLTQELGTVREVFLSPDGALSLIPFEVLQGPDGKFLIEDYTFNYLAAGRDVLGFGEARGKGEKPLLLGDPDFDMAPTGKAGTPSAPDSEPRRTVASTRSRDMRSLGFARLPGTRQEVLTIGGLLGRDEAAVYTGQEAVEERLTWKEPPRILHLATHGFFLTDQEVGDLTTGPAPLGEMGMPARRKGPPIENPLLRSGLALAGANTALRSGDETNSQGIVTAEKILGLRLRGTELVVLSACDTGVGEVKSGEGVFGLRRAFTQAGTKGLVMSLWSVPDRETKELMIEFYKNLLSGKMNRSQALRQAALTQMQVVRARYGQAHPFFWGAFVFLGEP